MDKLQWPAVIDPEYVERLIPAIQQAIVSVSPHTDPQDASYELSGPDLANAPFYVLATVLEPSSACSTPQGMRKLAEAAGKELHQLIRDVKRLKEADRVIGPLRH